ncbi:circularly permuted type 2 ATP-grasp protein [Sphingobium aquiterrae]|uniref:circularly permuted type 2 ATP-grasp protein n=1 Tax=Sphingobium aquiterrae TaxID=2038656 RepID=UPI003AFA7A7E
MIRDPVAAGWQADDRAQDQAMPMLRRYEAEANAGDLMLSAPPDMATRWQDMLEALLAHGDGDFAPLQERAARQVLDLGMAFRLAGEPDERAWPLSPVPLLIAAGEWRVIEAGMAQRAELLEHILADVYGPQQLVANGSLPAAVVTGSRSWWRQMERVNPPGGRYLHFYAADLARGPNGEWRVLADHTRAPTGAGYALENRLAMARVTGDLLGRLSARRLAPFFAAFRHGLAQCCTRSDPRIALLTPGRFNQSYAEQAHLARYLGLLLVEGEDLTVQDDRLYVRTIEGIKRIDAIWRRMDTRFLDPLTFDSRSRIGVPDLFAAIAKGGLVVANWPGAGIAESPAFGAFLPSLADDLLGSGLILPNIATWWCGQPAERDMVLAGLDNMAIGSAYAEPVPGLEDGRGHIGARLDDAHRAALLDGMARRPMDYVGQELVQLSTTPAIVNGELVPRPFTLRVFVTRDQNGEWRIMPGGFARLAGHGDIRAVLMGEGDMAADVCIVSDTPEEVVSLLDAAFSPPIRRVAGTLPSKAADNLFWLTRYLERAEMTLRMVRALLGGTIEADGAAALEHETMTRVAGLLAGWGAVEPEDAQKGITALCREAIADTAQPGSVHALLGSAATVGQGIRERLAAEYWRLLSAPLGRAEHSRAEPLLEHVGTLINRLSALSGLAAENMVRGHGWRFHDLGRRIERAIHLCRLLTAFAHDGARSDDLNVLLDLTDCQISYRMRYLSGLSLYPIRDMLGLEPQNPRSLAFQIERVARHLAVLPSLRNDGMPEAPVQICNAIVASLAATSADRLDVAALEAIETRLLALSDAIGTRFFLQGRDAERAVGMTRLA